MSYVRSRRTSHRKRGTLRCLKGPALSMLTQTRFDRKRECRPFTFIKLRTLFPAQKRQPSCFQRVHSLVEMGGTADVRCCNVDSPQFRRSSERELPVPRPTGSNPSKMNSYPKCSVNHCEINTSKSLNLKSLVMNTYEKNGGGGGLIVTQQRRRVLASKASLRSAKQALRRRPFGFRIDETAAAAQKLGVTH